MSGVQRARSTVPPLGCVAKRGARDSYLVEAGGVQSVKRLNEEVTRQEELTSAGGTNCDVWVGRWRRCCREGGGREEVYEEKVRLSLTTSTPLTWVFVGRVENASSVEGIGEGAQGSTLADCLHVVSNSYLLPRLLETRE